MKALVVYYSRDGNTKFVANEVAKSLKADVEALTDKKNRKGIFGYILGGRDALLGRETEIGELKYGPETYDLVIVGTPVWAHSVAPAVRTYLNKNELSGKKAAFFCTYGGSGAEQVLGQLAGLAHTKGVGTLALKKPLEDGTAPEEVAEWCKILKEKLGPAR